jgi:hypothetical protein
MCYADEGVLLNGCFSVPYLCMFEKKAAHHVNMVMRFFDLTLVKHLI